ncbi:MAG TPA: DMT family transporter [Rhodanobacteraceae bacterium]|nr:DMT family transporter [Rhodanobacteraceae bacterium]
MPRPKSRYAAPVALILLTLIWSYNWIVMKQVLRYVGPFDFAALRYVLGSGVLFIVLLARGDSLRPPPLVSTVLIGLAQTMGFQALVQWALVDGGAGKTALLAYTMPFWAVLLAWLLLAERPSRRQVIGLAVALGGLLLILEPWQGFGGARSAALAIAGGVCWGIGVVLSKRLFARGGTSALSLTAWQMLAGTIGLIVIAFAADEPALQWSGYFIGALAYNAVLSSGLAWVMWSFVVDRLPTPIAGLSSLTVPICGVLLAWVLLGERPSSMESCGIVLIAVALLVVNLRRHAATPPAGGGEGTHHGS